MAKKKVIIILVLLTLLCSLFPQFACARQYIAEEPAEENQIGYGDVVVEKEIESVFMPLSPMGYMGTPPPMEFGKKVVLYSVAEGKELDKIYNKTGAIWMNWPATRYVFGTADVNKAMSFLKGSFEFIPVGIFTSLANSIFNVTKTLVMMAINIVILAFNTQWAGGVASFMAEVTRDMINFEEDGFFKAIFLFSICGLAVAIVYNMIKSQITQALTAVIISVVVVALIFAYEANCDKLVHGVTEMTDDLAGLSMVTLTKVLPLEEGSQAAGEDPLNEGLRAASNAAWRTMVVYPWAATMFGTLDPNKLKVTEQEWKSIQGEIEDNGGILKTGTIRLGRGDLDKNKSQLYLDTLYLGAAADDRIKTAICTAVADKDIDHGEHYSASVLMHCSIMNALRFMGVSVLSLFPAVAFFLLCAIIGGSIIFAQCAIVILLIAAPFVLLCAMVPVVGWNLAIGFLKRMGGFLAVKVLYGFYLGAVLFIGIIAANLIVTPSGNFNIGTVMFALTVIFLGAIIYRKKFLNMAMSFSVKVQESGNPAQLINEMRRLVNAIRRTKGLQGGANTVSKMRNWKEGTPPARRPR